MNDRSPLPAAPTISIVTPSYNQGAFIEYTIKSVLTQSGDFFLDYLIIDGGSTDQTLDIVKKYSSMVSDRRWPVTCKGISFRWISEKDSGQSDAIAKGFRLANGTILAWLNSDDVYTDGALDRAVRAFREHRHAVLVYGQAMYIDESGATVGSYPAEPFDRRRLPVTNFICQPSAFFTRAVYDRSGGVNNDLRYTMDYDLWIRMAQHGSFAFIPECLSGFRLHGASKTVFPRYALENHKECLDTVRKYYQWAPLNRVVAYAYQVVLNSIPSAFTRSVWINVVLCLPISVVLYFRYNKWIRLDDVRMLTPANLSKLRNVERLWI